MGIDILNKYSIFVSKSKYLTRTFSLLFLSTLNFLLQIHHLYRLHYPLLPERVSKSIALSLLSERKKQGLARPQWPFQPLFQRYLPVWRAILPLKAWKNLSCLGRQKRFLSWYARRDSNPRSAFGTSWRLFNTIRSSVPAPTSAHFV